MTTDKKWVTNLHSDAQEFELSSGGFIVLQPGQTENISLARPSSTQILGSIHAGLLSISDKEPKAPGAAPLSAEVAVTKSAEVAAAQQPRAEAGKK